MIKQTLIAAAAIAIGSAALLPTQAMAQVGVNVIIGAPPPPLRYEAMPPPRVGYVWAPGYWGWNGRSHVWMRGSWMRDRPGYVYAQPHWIERGGRWHYEQAHWNRHSGRGDRDHDGIPNRYDRHDDRYDRGHHGGRPGYGYQHGRDRDHDGIPNRHDRDRDGDGVPNRHDRQPDNPRR